MNIVIQAVLILKKKKKKSELNNWALKNSFRAEHFTYSQTFQLDKLPLNHSNIAS